MNIYIPIEIKVRELEGKTLLALAAAERGHIVILGSKENTINLAKKGILPPGIVHDKSLTPGNYKLENYKNLKHFGHLITAQDEESGLLDESFEKFATQRFSSDTIAYADKIFTWGNHDYNSLTKLYPDYTDKFINTGSPRVDLWRNELSAYYSGKESVLIDDKPYILIVSNFSSLLDNNKFWDRVSRLREAGYFERDSEMERYMYYNSAYQLKLIHAFVELTRNLADTFPELHIVIRPHPVESIDGWKKLIGKCPNIIIERQGSISGWIRKAIAIIHNGCTSAIEASATDIPRIAYRPIPHELEREIPNKMSIDASSIDQVSTLIKQLIHSGTCRGIQESDERAQRVLKHRFSNLTGEMAVDKIVDAWEIAAQDNGLNHLDLNDILRKKPINNRAFHLLKNTYSKIKKIVNGKHIHATGKNTLLVSSHKFSSLTEDEMTEISKHLKNTLSRFQNVQMKTFGDKTFIFYSDNG